MSSSTLNTSHPRERLVRTAATLVHRQGWTITGINQILTEAGIPKGSFYYYFRSKEALGVAVLQHHYANLKTLLERTLMNESLRPVEAIREFTREISIGQAAEEYRFGCPAGNLAGEIATQCPALLAEANRSLELYRQAWSQLIARAQRAGEISSELDADTLASSATMLVQGALLAFKCAGTPTPINLLTQTLEKLFFERPAPFAIPAAAVAAHRPGLALAQ